MTRIVPPEERVCERCGRRDEWDPDRGAWVATADEDGEVRRGTQYCLHEWDINGAYNPVAE